MSKNSDLTQLFVREIQACAWITLHTGNPYFKYISVSVYHVSFTECTMLLFIINLKVAMLLIMLRHVLALYMTDLYINPIDICYIIKNSCSISTHVKCKVFVHM